MSQKPGAPGHHSQPAPRSGTLPSLRESGYASGSYGSALIQSVLELTLLFVLTDIYRYPPALAGLIFFVAVASETGFHILVAWMSDSGRFRRKHKQGPLILLGAPLCVLSLTTFFVFPLIHITSPILVASVLIGAKLSTSMMFVPHNALLMSLPGGPPTRARVAVLRFGFSTLGFLCVSMGLSRVFAVDAAQELSLATVAVSGVGITVLGVVIVVGSWRIIKGLDLWIYSTDRRYSLATAARALAHRNFFMILAAAAFDSCTTLLFAKSLLHYATYVLGSSTQASYILTSMVGGQLLALPFWHRLSARTAVETLLAAAFGVLAVGCLIFFLTSKVSVIAACSAAIVMGLGIAGTKSLIWAVAAGIIERRARATNVEIGTLGFGLVSVCSKLASGVGALVFGVTMDVVGYAPGVVQSPAGEVALSTLNSLLPAAGAIMALVCIRRMRSFSAQSE